MRNYMAQTWHRMWKENSDELKFKAVVWRSEPTIHRIERPSRLDRARRLGYKAKRKVAERSVAEKFPNLEVIGSYFLHKDGMNIWYEVILADPSHPAISKDREMRGKLKAFAK
jgi:large subunit ribosomal protein L15e